MLFLSIDSGSVYTIPLQQALAVAEGLIAQADRIMLLDGHAAPAIDRAAFRRLLAGSLRKTANDLNG